MSAQSVVVRPNNVTNIKVLVEGIVIVKKKPMTMKDVVTADIEERKIIIHKRDFNKLNNQMTHQPKTKCCDRCFWNRTDGDLYVGIFCKDKNCSCHNQPTPEAKDTKCKRIIICGLSDGKTAYSRHPATCTVPNCVCGNQNTKCNCGLCKKELGKKKTTPEAKPERGEESWEKKWDDRFCHHLQESSSGTKIYMADSYMAVNLKDFIRQLLAAQRQEIAEKLKSRYAYPDKPTLEEILTLLKHHE